MVGWVYNARSLPDLPELEDGKEPVLGGDREEPEEWPFSPLQTLVSFVVAVVVFVLLPIWVESRTPPAERERRFLHEQLSLLLDSTGRCLECTAPLGTNPHSCGSCRRAHQLVARLRGG